MISQKKIKVRLTQGGKTRHINFYSELKRRVDDRAAPINTEPVIDGDGYTEYEFWLFMKIFKPDFSESLLLLFENNEICFDTVSPSV